MKNKEDKGVYFITEKGRVIGIADDSRLKAAKWWQRLFAWVSKDYKSKFIDFNPIPIKSIKKRK